MVQLGNQPISPALQSLLRLTGGDFDNSLSMVQANEIIKQLRWQSPIGTERWEMQLPVNLQNKAEQIVQFCYDALGMKHEILPETDLTYHGILFLGAALERVVDRLSFYNQQIAACVIDPSLKIWVLTGVRKLSEQAGETNRELMRLVPHGAETIAMPETELQMIQYVFHYLLPAGIEVEYIESDKDVTHTRATTSSTMIAFLDKLQLNQPHHFLAISNQPLIAYQQSAIDLVLHKLDHPGTGVTVIGGAVHENMNNIDNLAATLLDTVAKTIGNEVLLP